MPQMAPLLWTPLMMTFSALLIMMMIFMFFYAPVFEQNSKKTQTSKINTLNKNWTW